MRAVDTNILIRLLIKDDAEAFAKVYAFIKKAQEEEERFLVVFPVVLEIIWVLGSRYRYERNDIVAAIELLVEWEFLKFESPFFTY